MVSESTSQSLTQLSEAVSDFPTIPETLTRILRLLEDPNSGARDLAVVIQSDAPLAAKILRLANSPLYHKKRTIGTVQECVSVLGYRTVRQVALCVAVISSLQKDCQSRAVTLDYRDLWHHCVAVGAVAKELATRAGHPDAETVFTGGLLHDLGKFLLTIRYPRQYADLIESRTAAAKPLIELEREAFGFDHAAAGAALADAWQFPPELVTMIGGHHATNSLSRDAALVQLADCVANTVQPSRSDLGFDPEATVCADLCVKAGLPTLDLDTEGEALREVIDAAAMLGQLD